MPRLSLRQLAGKKNKKKVKHLNGGRYSKNEETEYSSSSDEDDRLGLDLDLDEKMRLRDRPLQAPNIWEPKDLFPKSH
jgi:hypothetical protein